jgi:hypothetical protein
MKVVLVGLSDGFVTVLQETVKFFGLSYNTSFNYYLLNDFGFLDLLYGLNERCKGGISRLAEFLSKSLEVRCLLRLQF